MDSNQNLKTSLEYDFNRCKLCHQLTAIPTYHLNDGIVYRCHHCDFHFLNQLDDLSNHAENTVQLTEQSRRYIEMRENESSQLHPSRLRLIQSSNNSDTSKLLDIGAGLGQFQLQLNERGYETHGIEPSHLRRLYAAEKFSLQLSDKLVDDDFWQKNYGEYFDLITLWDVIEHVNFPHETLEHAVKLLKPGGLLLLDTPSREVLSYRISETCHRLSSGKISLYLPNFYSSAPFGHKQIFTPTQLSGLLQELGLQITYRAKSYGSNPQRGNKIILVGQKNGIKATQGGHCPPDCSSPAHSVGDAHPTTLSTFQDS